MFLCFRCFWGQSKKTSFNLKIEKALYALGEKGKNALSNFDVNNKKCKSTEPLATVKEDSTFHLIKNKPCY